MKLIPSIKKLFWDIDKESLNIFDSKRDIIVRTLNNGTLGDWQWLKKTYGINMIKNIMAAPRHGIRDRSLKLAKLIF